MITLMSDEPLPISLLRATTMLLRTRTLSEPEKLLVAAIGEVLRDYDSKNPSRSGPQPTVPLLREAPAGAATRGQRRPATDKGVERCSLYPPTSSSRSF